MSAKGLPRAAELALAAAALVVAAPVMALAAVAVMATSRGGFVFRQARVGRHGVPFTIYKLRTMRANGGALLTGRNDQRITPVGRWLRLFKIDELPQLVNVLRGEMSLVGPRPEVSPFVDLDDPRWRLVLSDRPGITDPITLALRREERLIPQEPGEAEAYYRTQLVPLKLEAYARYRVARTWKTDLVVLGRTIVRVIAPETDDTPQKLPSS